MITAPKVVTRPDANTRRKRFRMSSFLRSRNTTRMTGNNPAVQSSHQGCMMSLVLASLVLSSTWVMPILANSALRVALAASSAATAWRRCGKK